MKRLLLIISSVLYVFGMCVGSTSFMVLSDPHVMSTTLFDSTASFNGDPKLNEHSQELFDSAVTRILAATPDILLIPGDLTKDGEHASHLYVQSQLERIVQNGTKVYVVPGNHDVNNPSASSYLNGRQAKVPSLSADSFATLYALCGYADAVMRMADGLSYMAYPAPGLALICLDSNKKNTTSRQSAGGLSEALLQWAEQASAQAHEDGRVVIGMMHHNIVEHFDGHARFASTYVANTSDDMPALEDVQQRLITAGFKVMLTGHFHIQSMQHVTTSDGELYDITTGALCSLNSPLRTMVWNDTVLKVTSDTIGLYYDLKCERNTNTTKGAIRVAANKGYPMIQDSLSILPAAATQMMNLPESKEQMIADMDSFFLEPYTIALNSLSLGDENLHPKGTPLYFLDVKIGCMRAFNAYVDYLLGDYKNASILTPGYVRVQTTISAARTLVENYLSSVLENYVGATTNVVPDNSITITLERPAVPDRLPDSAAAHNKAAKANKSIEDGTLVLTMPDGTRYNATGRRL